MPLTRPKKQPNPYVREALGMHVPFGHNFPLDHHCIQLIFDRHGKQELQRAKPNHPLQANYF